MFFFLTETDEKVGVIDHGLRVAVYFHRQPILNEVLSILALLLGLLFWACKGPTGLESFTEWMFLSWKPVRTALPLCLEGF